MLSRLRPIHRLILKSPNTTSSFDSRHCRYFGDQSQPFPSPFPFRPVMDDTEKNRTTPDNTESTHHDGDIDTNNYRQDNLVNNEHDSSLLLRDHSGVLLNEHTKPSLQQQDSTPTFYRRHLFDTYKLVQSLEQQDFNRLQAQVIMKGIKSKLQESTILLGDKLLLRSDLENESYLFKAELSELRTEIQIMRRNDTQTLQTDAAILTREVETLAQRLREDVTTMKNEVTLDLNSRKNETQEEQKAIDMKIQEINNRFTVQMGEVRTELEAVRWETIWKGMAGVVVAGIGIASLGYLLTRFADRQAEAALVEKLKRKKLVKEEARQSGVADMEVIY